MCSRDRILKTAHNIAGLPK